MRTVSSKHLLQRIAMLLKPQSSTWHFDAIEFMGQAQRLIGYHCGYAVKVSEPIEIINHKGCYPCDMECLYGVIYNGRYLPLGSDVSKVGIIKRLNTDTTQTTASDVDLADLTVLTDLYETQAAAYASDPSQDNLDAMQATMTRLANLAATVKPLRNASTNRIHDYYAADLDYIQTSFSSGYVYMVYNAFKTDKEGFPLLIDNEKYLQACMWFVISQLLLQGYTHQTITYALADSKWESFRTKAANSQKMNSQAKHEKLAARWTNLKLNRNLPSQFDINGEVEQGFIL